MFTLQYMLHIIFHLLQIVIHETYYTISVHKQKFYRNKNVQENTLQITDDKC